MKDTTNENIVCRKSNIERLPVVIRVDKTKKLLGIYKLSSGTGDAQASAVNSSSSDWQLKDDIIGMSFNTRASNTVRQNGDCVMLEKKKSTEIFCIFHADITSTKL